MLCFSRIEPVDQSKHMRQKLSCHYFRPAKRSLKSQIQILAFSILLLHMIFSDLIKHICETPSSFQYNIFQENWTTKNKVSEGDESKDLKPNPTTHDTLGGRRWRVDRGRTWILRNATFIRWGKNHYQNSVLFSIEVNAIKINLFLKENK